MVLGRRGRIGWMGRVAANVSRTASGNPGSHTSPPLQVSPPALLIILCTTGFAANAAAQELTGTLQKSRTPAHDHARPPQHLDPVLRAQRVAVITLAVRVE